MVQAWLRALCLAAGIAGAHFVAVGSALAGALLLVASIAVLRWRGLFWDVDTPPELSRSARWLALAVVAGTAALFRLYHMVPPGLWGDDAINGLLAIDVLDGKITSPFQLVSHAQSRFHAFSSYPVAASFALLGPGLASLRLPGVILSFLSVLLVYGTFAPLFRARTALCAALFFATSAMELSNGKILIQNATGQFLQLLGMCLLVRGFSGRRRWLIALSGVPLGLSLCTYHAFKLGPLVAAAAAAILLQAAREDRRRLAWWCGGGGLLLLVAAAPGLYAYAVEPTALTGRIGGTSVLEPIRAHGDLWPLWDSLWRTLAIFPYRQGPVLYHWVGVGTEPALGTIVSFLALLGLVQSIRRRREPRHLLLLVWFAIGLVPGILSSEAPRVYRVLLATPPVFVWAALPLERLLAWAEVGRSRSAAILAGLILLAVPIGDFDHYFFGVYTNPSYRWAHATRMVEMAQKLRALGPEWKGYLLSKTYDAQHETFTFLRRIWKIDLRDVESLADIMPLRADENALLLFDTTTLPMLGAVESFYPGFTATKHRGPRYRSSAFDELLGTASPSERNPQWASLPLSRAAMESIRGLRAVFLAGDGAPLGSQIWPRFSARPDTRDLGQMPEAASIDVAGALYAPSTGTYAFALEATTPASLWLDGHELLSTPQRLTSLELVQGLHQIRARIDAGGAFALRWQPPGQPWGEIPPALLYRSDEIHGWVLEQDGAARRQKRLEPVPWYGFFPSSMVGRYRAHWRGRLCVPAGGRILNVHARGTPKVLLDGGEWQPDVTLAQGLHDIELTVDEVEGPLLIDLSWRDPERGSEPIGLEAFLPPAPWLAPPLLPGAASCYLSPPERNPSP